MKVRLPTWIMLIGATLLPLATAHAETYAIGVSHKATNLYKIDGKDMLIHTRDCDAYGYTGNASLKTGEAGAELRFNDTKEKCAVEGVYDAAKPSKKKYGVTISRVETDWFEVSGSKLYLKSEPRCLLMAIKEPVTLEVSGDVGGYLIFPSGKKCKVEGMYNRASM